MTEIIEVQLDEGGRLFVEAATAPGRHEIGAIDAVRIDQLVETVSTFGVAIRNAALAAAPSKATVEFGVEVRLEASGLVALIARGTGAANVKVSLEWGGEERR